MDILQYPFDCAEILKKHVSLKRTLNESQKNFISKKVAVLGGSTTSAIIDILDLFLLNNGIRCEFYESEYSQYWQDAMFDSELENFKPDIIFIHTTCRNISHFPTVKDSEQQINDKLKAQLEHFTLMWENLRNKYNCPIIQNNLERPVYRLLANKDISDLHGKSNFISRLNQAFYEYSQKNQGFYINDIDYLASEFGLGQWHDLSAWYRYKYAMSMQAIPLLSNSVANIIKAIYGYNKKALVLDLDNTLWGGVVGDDGPENLKLGPEMPLGQAYSSFQEYIQECAQLGVILTVCSKNDEANAIAGLEHPDSLLKPGDFAVIKANWENKDGNIIQIANALNIGLDSMVFVDDNPAERHIVKAQLPMVSVPEIKKVEEYISVLEKNAFFESPSLTGDDLARGKMYKENAQRASLQQSFKSHEEFLLSLEMHAEIQAFQPVYIARISQLTNKSNQFNLTTKRYTESEIRAISENNEYISLYGKLEDKFGDNGLVSVVIGKKENNELHIDLWLMSCRVLKRNMEHAMLDALVNACEKREINKIFGYYYPTAKNSMVKNFYEEMKFNNVSNNNDGSSIWVYDVEKHSPANKVIEIQV